MNGKQIIIKIPVLRMYEPTAKDPIDAKMRIAFIGFLRNNIRKHTDGFAIADNVTAQ